MSLGSVVRTEGGLLPSDLIARVVARDKDLTGLDPQSYGLAQGETISEATGRSWARLRGLWASFREVRAKSKSEDALTKETRERWLLPLFQELDYGKLERWEATSVGTRSYAISHRHRLLPIHLIGANLRLDRKTPGVAHAAAANPHGLLQDFLNRKEEFLWGVVSNGLRLRLLRDNVALTRQAFVEFDLEGIFEAEDYPSFVVLWLLAHQSRFDGAKPHDWIIEQWSRKAVESGSRALDQLRHGVEQALAHLGTGFLCHPANQALADRLRKEERTPADLKNQLMRLVYRLLFLFVAEDRGLLQDPKAPVAARDRYRRYYSTARLRSLALGHGGSPHGDAWEQLRFLFKRLRSEQGCPELGLYYMGSRLFSADSCADLEGASLSNQHLFAALRALCLTRDGKLRRKTDFLHLGAEELGSVYESLLELVPQIHGGERFELVQAQGNARKLTGSYYTPTPLIQELLRTALDPVLDTAEQAADPVQAILSIKVCDPACGSGHFLVAAAHRIARRLASVRTQDVEPAPEEVRHALREVVARCLYGVDLNSLSAELCKVSLWLESLDPGKPLAFLDHRIKVGNSLIGTTPELISQGIPDEAFTPITGDDKSIASGRKKVNRQERESQVTEVADLFAQPLLLLSTPPPTAVLRQGDDGTLAGVKRIEEAARQVEEDPVLSRLRLQADYWTAAFLVPKRDESPFFSTGELRRFVQVGPEGLPREKKAEIDRLRAQYLPFHWHVEFPDVFNTEGAGGFDVVLGNPPWDTLSPDAKEFFASYNPQVRFQDREGQQQIIDGLLQESAVSRAWDNHCRFLYGQVHFFKDSGRYRLFAPGNLGKGDFNIYRMFVEAALQLARPGGVAAQVVPENLYNGANAMAIRRELLDRFEWQVLVGCENAQEVWFSGIDTRMKFCIYVARKQGRTEKLRAAFNVRSTQQLAEVRTGRTLEIPVSLIEEFSPEALAIMELSSQKDIDIATKMYAAWPKFGDEKAGPPHRHYMREVDMGTDRELFTENPSGLPVYEGRMIDQFDYRAKAYKAGRGRAAEWVELNFGDSDKKITPQWYILNESLPEKVRDRITRYRVGFCDVASPTNERTLIASLLPPGTVSGHKVPTIAFEEKCEWAYMVWLAIANSFSMDFLARKKVSLSMSYTVLDSLPFPRLAQDHPQAKRIVGLAARLTCTSEEMRGYWNLLASAGWVPRLMPDEPLPALMDDSNRRATRAELDVLVARDLFRITRDEMEYILDTFPLVRGEDEKRGGEYRTKNLIMESWERTGP